MTSRIFHAVNNLLVTNRFFKKQLPLLYSHKNTSTHYRKISEICSRTRELQLWQLRSNWNANNARKLKTKLEIFTLLEVWRCRPNESILVYTRRLANSAVVKVENGVHCRFHIGWQNVSQLLTNAIINKLQIRTARANSLSAFLMLNSALFKCVQS